MNEPISISRGSVLPQLRPVPNATASGDGPTTPISAVPAIADATSDRPLPPATPPQRQNSRDETISGAVRQATETPPINATATDGDPAIDAAQQQSPPAEEQVDAAVTQINNYFGNVNRTIRFKVDDETGVTLINVVDTETDKVIRQVPPEEMLVIARRVSESDDEVKLGLLLSSAV